MSDRFDFEQQIMHCWNVIDDLKMVMEYRDSHQMTEDEFSNAILGIQTLYQMKFEMLFDLFEKMLRNN